MPYGNQIPNAVPLGGNLRGSRTISRYDIERFESASEINTSTDKISLNRSV